MTIAAPVGRSTVVLAVDEPGYLRVGLSVHPLADDLVMKVRPDALDSMRAVVPERLVEFGDIVHEDQGGQIGRLTPWAVTDALRSLRESGLDLLGQVLQDGDVSRLMDYMTGIWRGRSFDPFGATAPMMLILGSAGAFVPFEWMPLLSGGAPIDDIKNDSDLYRAVSAFPVFSASVRREPKVDGVIPPGVVTKRAPDEVNVRVFVHSGLEGSLIEVERLSSTPGVTLDGPHPLLGTTVAEVATLIVDPPSPDVLHVSCHGAPDPTGRLQEVALELRPVGTVEPMAVKIRDLRTWAVERSADHRPVSTAPLVWLNACVSAQPTLLAASSLPAFFLERTSAGVVGVEAVVSDRVAAEMSRIFYRRWLEGTALSRALLMARLERLRVSWDPLGAIFTAFGSTDVALRRSPVDLEARVDIA